VGVNEYGDAAADLIEGVFARGVRHAVVLMRHSAREFDPLVNDLVNPLTEEGRELCRRLGRALPKDLTLRGYASPAERCLETAKLILESHQGAGGESTRHRPVEALGVFYVLDQMKMWKGMREADGLVNYLKAWFAGDVPADAMMPPELAAKLVLRVMTEKLHAPVGAPQLDLCVSHDMTVHLVRDRLLDEAVDGPEVEFLDALIAYRDDEGYWLQSHHGPARQVNPVF
jgi:broad specificity phosphatase PhoE